MQHDHISHVGCYAGVRYCGATDGTSCHLPYVADVDAWAREHIACAQCREILADAAPAPSDADVASDPRA